MSGFERTEIFIESLNEGNTEFLDNLEAEANRDNVPIIRKSMQRFLKLMLELKKPKNILEVGTAVGFSAILMAQYSQSDCHITTIEKYEKRIPVAKENFLKSGFNDKITLIEGDAKDILNELLENENERLLYHVIEKRKKCMTDDEKRQLNVIIEINQRN